MRCEDLRQALANYAQGRVPVHERQVIEAHLRDCPACRAVLAEMDPVAAALVQSQAPPIPAGFAERAMAAARSRIAKPAATWNPLLWWRTASAPMRGAAAAVLVVGFLGGVMVGRDAVRTPANQAAGVTSPSDPWEGYNLDYLGDAPEGSLANSYLALVSGHDGEGH